MALISFQNCYVGKKEWCITGNQGLTLIKMTYIGDSLHFRMKLVMTYCKNMVSESMAVLLHAGLVHSPRKGLKYIVIEFLETALKMN